MSEWTIGAVLDEIADVIPDRTMTVCGDRRSTFAESADRTRRLANFLSGNGLGVHRERAVLQNWECGQDRVALIMHNDLYPDMVVGCLKARTVPVNVNYHYTPREVGELFDYLRPRAVIYHRGLGPKFADVLGRGDVDLLIAVDDGSEAGQLPGAVSLDDALAQGDTGHPVPGSPDDLLMICTGGTTGRPKGVLWRQSDIYVSSMVGADHACAQEIRDKVSGAAGAPWFAVSPLMHAAGMWTAFAAIMSGTTVVLYDTGKKLDPRSVWETAQRERVGMMTMVGDAYAAPLVAELRRGSYDLSSLYAIGTGERQPTPNTSRPCWSCFPHHSHQRLRVVGDRQHGIRPQPNRHPNRHLHTARGWAGARRGLQPLPFPGEPQLGWVAREDESRWGTSTIPTPPARPFRRSTANEW